MDKEKVKTLYTVPDYQGYPTSVPADRVHDFLKRQEELKAIVARGEKIPELDEKSKKALSDFGKLLKEWAKTPPEEHTMNLGEWLEAHTKD